MKMFSPPQEASSFPQKEEEIQQFWKEEQIVQKTLSPPTSCDSKQIALRDRAFIFYDGPPFATGLPHYGHLLASTIKDVVPRYATMKGRYVARRFGWDCHGLPIEALVEKKLGLSGSASIREYGIDRFNETCRENVLTFTKQWKEVMERLGRWVDMERPYKTMDLSYMETLWTIFQKLYQKGLVYEGYKVMPYSWKLGTELSNFEASENYREIDDPSVVVAFRDANKSSVAYLVWTTTPWTLPSNRALAVCQNFNYISLPLASLAESSFPHLAAVEKMRAAGISQVVLSQDRLHEIFGLDLDQDLIGSVQVFSGFELVGRAYKPLFPFFPKEEGCSAPLYEIVHGEFLEEGQGTGIVHIAPAYGEEDFQLCQELGIALVGHVDERGHFDRRAQQWSGLNYREGSKEVIVALKERGQLLWRQTIRHRVPFCWRTDTPLIYKACRTWFIAVERLRDRLVALNESIHWVPSHIKEGRFGKWIAQARDWAVSRNRFWGTPLPIWKEQEGDELLVVGSRAELEELTGARIEDLHRHKIDDLIVTKEGKNYKRIDAVFDCWFESGSMPYAQLDGPFDQEGDEEEGDPRPAKIARAHPAHFIAEGLDQTRGWFYTLHVLSTALFDRAAFENVIVNGIILAEDGQKMSKRLQNYPDPMLVMRTYGADALRLYLLKSPVVRGEDLCFQEKEVELVMRQVILPWSNSHRFFLTYAHLYEFEPSRSSWQSLSSGSLPKHLLDRWILSRAAHLGAQIDEAMESYHLWQAIEPMLAFLEELTNWYIRRARRRFWSDEASKDRYEAFDTLYRVLVHFAKLAAPFTPFLSERIYRELLEPQRAQISEERAPISVHLCSYPQVATELIDPKLEREMEMVRKVVNMGHALRKNTRLKVRQPLASITVSLEKESELLSSLLAYEEMICDELNVQRVVWTPLDSASLQVSFKLNFKVAGKKLGSLMREAKKWVEESMGHEEAALLTQEGYLRVTLPASGSLLVLEEEDLEIEYHVSQSDDQVALYNEGVKIALDTRLNEELIALGRVRELVNKVNTERKALGLEVTDRIKLYLRAPGHEVGLEELKRLYEQEISSEILSRQIVVEQAQEASLEEDSLMGWVRFDLNGWPSAIRIERL